MNRIVPITRNITRDIVVHLCDVAFTWKADRTSFEVLLQKNATCNGNCALYGRFWCTSCVKIPLYVRAFDLRVHLKIQRHYTYAIFCLETCYYILRVCMCIGVVGVY